DSANSGLALTVAGTLLLVAGVFAPSLVAVALTAHESGPAGVRALLGRLFEARAAKRWYLFALGYEALILTLVLLSMYLYTGHWPPLRPGSGWNLLLALTFGLIVQAGEEIGWRGY